MKWDGESDFSTEDKPEIERFISNVLLYQRFDLERREMSALKRSEIGEFDEKKRPFNTEVQHPLI